MKPEPSKERSVEKEFQAEGIAKSMSGKCTWCVAETEIQKGLCGQSTVKKRVGGLRLKCKEERTEGQLLHLLGGLWGN